MSKLFSSMNMLHALLVSELMCGNLGGSADMLFLVLLLFLGVPCG